MDETISSNLPLLAGTSRIKPLSPVAFHSGNKMIIEEPYGDQALMQVAGTLRWIRALWETG